MLVSYTKNVQFIGIIWMLLHCFSEAVAAILVRMVSVKFHIFEIIFTQNLFSFLCVIPFMLFSKETNHFRTSNFRLLLFAAILGISSLALFFYALTLLPLADVRALALTSALVTSFFAIIFLKEKLDINRILGLIIGFIGVLLIIRPGAESFSYLSLLMIIVVCLRGAIDLIIKLLSQANESTLTQLFYVNGLIALLSSPIAFIHWVQPATYTEWMLLAGIGIIFPLSMICVINAFKYAELTAVMPFDFSGVVFTAVFAYLMFSESVSQWTLVGGAIVVASNVYIARKEYTKQPNRERLSISPAE